jgi:tripartite-type tricarboxylate transporter receptor subunit TctC
VRSIRHAAILVILLSMIPAATAQSNYPGRSIRIIYGFPPGADTVTRLVADKLAEALGQPVVVDNITGAGGNIAADRTAKAPPDGYTIGILPVGNIVINVSLYNKLSYDPATELVPVIQIYGYPNILLINNDVPARNVAELIALARAQPGKLTFGHSGIGTTTHLAGELLKRRAGIDIQGVPYRGPPQVLTDLLGGRLTMTFNTPSTTLSLVQQGRIRALAVTSLERAPFAPQLPTMDESGFPGFELTPWFGMFVPTGTPVAIIERLHRETSKIIAMPDVNRKVNDLGLLLLGNTPAEFAAQIRAETKYWARFIEEAGIQRID